MKSRRSQATLEHSPKREMRRAVVDPSLTARVVSQRSLRYTTPARPGEDRPEHVRAASALAVIDDTIFVAQDDTSFIGVIEGDTVDAITLPHAPGGRRRFEDALGNKRDKLDLECCIAIDGELIVFGSGSRKIREQLCRVQPVRAPDGRIDTARSVATIVEARPFYAALRDAIGAINLEGATIVGGELWLFHRGNTGPDDGPAVVRIARSELAAILDGRAPEILGVDRYDLGEIDGVRLGFTDATGSPGCVWIACAAEASHDAIDDGGVTGSRLGVIDGPVVRCAPLLIDGAPCKVEGLAGDPGRSNTAWITIDPDDPERAAVLCQVVISGRWSA